MKPRVLPAALLGLVLTAVVPATAAAAPLPSPAQAYWESDDELVYSGGWGKTNQVTITNYGSASFLIDDVTRIVPGAGCVSVVGDDTRAICTDTDPSLGWLAVYLNDGNDTLDYQASFNSYANLHGGSGDDTILIETGAGAYVAVTGDAGADTLMRTGGNAYVVVEGGTGADTMCGTDVYVTYKSHTQGVTASIGGAVYGDGAPGEGDTVCPSVRSITGTPYADTLSVAGSTGPTSLSGGAGNDTLTGNAVRDSLWGGPGNDVLTGNGGDDHLVGEDGVDTLNGGAGTADECRADGVDTLYFCEDVF